MAVMAAGTDGEAAYHLGVQNPLPGRSVPHGPEKSYIRRCRSDR